VNKALIKANDDLVSWCKCTSPAYASSGQLDCPWCGCGWLFTCMSCRRAFSFAKVVSSEIPLRKIMQQERSSYRNQPVALDDKEVISRTEWLDHELEPLPVGTICAYLDGKVLAVDSTDIRFNGWFALHRLDAVPQWSAHGSKAKIEALLGSKAYWLERELTDGDVS
jgi:hypothetical protein